MRRLVITFLLLLASAHAHADEQWRITSCRPEVMTTNKIDMSGGTPKLVGQETGIPQDLAASEFTTRACGSAALCAVRLTCDMTHPTKRSTLTVHQIVICKKKANGCPSPVDCWNDPDVTSQAAESYREGSGKGAPFKVNENNEAIK